MILLYCLVNMDTCFPLHCINDMSRFFIVNFLCVDKCKKKIVYQQHINSGLGMIVVPQNHRLSIWVAEIVTLLYSYDLMYIDFHAQNCFKRRIKLFPAVCIRRM